MNDRLKFRVWRQENPFVENWQPKYVYLTLGLESGFYKTDIIEQCTGLIDKNGKLIYEGDIIKKEFKNKPFSSKAKTKEKLIKVKWNDVEACFSFDFLNEKDKHDDFQCWENSWGHKYSNDEIIGNIHENIDLLCN